MWWYVAFLKLLLSPFCIYTDYSEGISTERIDVGSFWYRLAKVPCFAFTCWCTINELRTHSLLGRKMLLIVVVNSDDFHWHFISLTFITVSHTSVVVGEKRVRYINTELVGFQLRMLPSVCPQISFQDCEVPAASTTSRRVGERRRSVVIAREAATEAGARGHSSTIDTPTASATSCHRQHWP